MDTSVSAERVRDLSPRTQARVAGVLWLTCIVSGIVSFAAGPALLRGQNGATMAATIVANERLFRVGVVADIISGASYVGVTALLFYLLKPSGRSRSLVAASFGLVGVAIGGAGFLAHAAMLVRVHGERVFAALTAAQLVSALTQSTPASIRWPFVALRALSRRFAGRRNHSIGERRFITLGESDRSGMLVVAHADIAKL